MLGYMLHFTKRIGEAQIDKSDVVFFNHFHDFLCVRHFRDPSVICHLNLNC